MASTRALNNDEGMRLFFSCEVSLLTEETLVVAEMRKMLSFIKQEALEKAREIKVKVLTFLAQMVQTGRLPCVHIG